MGRLSLLALALPAWLLVACSTKPSTSDAAPDRKKLWLDGIYVVPEVGPDWNPWPVDASGPSCDPASIGKFCTGSADCNIKLGMECLKTDPVTSTGICACQCKPDDPKTPLSEDNCPESQTGKNQCVPVSLATGEKVGYCMRACKPKIGANDCPDKIACDPNSAVNFKLSQPVCAYPGCTKAESCPVSTTTVCSVAKKNCPTGEACMAVLGGQDEGRCQRPGKCDPVSGLCDAHSLGKPTATVGDRCESDLDCAGNMRCLAEIDESKYYKKTGASCGKDSDCCSRTCDTLSKTCTKAVCTVLRRHGYCIISGCEYGDTLTIRACPAGSACNLRFYTGYCQKTCDMTKPEDCRGGGEVYGDYECRRWGSLPAYMKTDVPVCDFGTGLRCSFFAGSSYDCSKLGADATNSTHMKCRTLDGKDAPGGAYDPIGFCLDDPGAGAVYRNPVPLP